MTAMKVFPADTLQQAKDAYAAWAQQHSDIRIIGRPIVEQINAGWKIIVLYQTV